MNEEYDLELYPEDFALVKEIKESISNRERHQAFIEKKEALRIAKNELQALKLQNEKLIKDELAKAFDFAKSNNIHCLSKVLKSPALPLSWQCNDGHKWKETLASLSEHATCPACEKIKLKARTTVDAT